VRPQSEVRHPVGAIGLTIAAAVIGGYIAVLAWAFGLRWWIVALLAAGPVTSVVLLMSSTQRIRRIAAGVASACYATWAAILLSDGEPFFTAFAVLFTMQVAATALQRPKPYSVGVSRVTDEPSVLRGPTRATRYRGMHSP